VIVEINSKITDPTTQISVAWVQYSGNEERRGGRVANPSSGKANSERNAIVLMCHDFKNGAADPCVS